MSHFIDKIFYINLDRRTDRLEEIQEELQKLDLTAERFRAIQHEEGLVGCGYSHLHIMKIAKERGYKNVLILEDDFSFKVSKDEFENLLEQFFTKVQDNYDVCMFSYGEEITETNNDLPFLVNIKSACDASAYIINGSYLDKLIELYEVNIPLLEQTRMHWVYANDQVWKRLQAKDKWFGFAPRLGSQRPGYSDNRGRYCN